MQKISIYYDSEMQCTIFERELESDIASIGNVIATTYRDDFDCEELDEYTLIQALSQQPQPFDIDEDKRVVRVRLIDFERIVGLRAGVLLKSGQYAMINLLSTESNGFRAREDVVESAFSYLKQQISATLVSTSGVIVISEEDMHVFIDDVRKEMRPTTSLINEEDKI